MNDEVPDEGDFDAGRRRGEFDDITPEDFIRGIGNPPGWLASGEINRMRGEMPIPYVLVVPVRTDDLGRVSQVGSCFACLTTQYRANADCRARALSRIVA